MTVKLTFLGSGSAFTIGPENYQSNILLEKDNDSLLIDAGTDLKCSSRDQGKSYLDFKNVYISHLHGDHCGGLEWLALTTFFDETDPQKPRLFCARPILELLWDHALSAGLSTLPSVQASIDTFFEVHPIRSHEGFFWQSIKFQLVQTIHYYSGYELMPSFGLIFNVNKNRIFITTDTQAAPSQLLSFYEEADIIFHDCETLKHPSGVHAHYTELMQLPKHLKKKMWLYHYNPGQLPEAKKDGFLGFVMKGQSFSFD
jgi:ribonuclease BN (tRNA processing enzyme)